MTTRAVTLSLALATLLGGLFAAFTPGAARADSRGEVVFLAGYPILSADLDIGVKKSLGNSYALGAQMNWFLTEMPAAFGMVVQGAFGGLYGFAPVMQTAVSFTYYPLARPHHHYTVDNEVQVSTTAWVPFARVQAGVASVVMNDPATGDRVGTTSLGYGLIAGVDFPVDWHKARPGVEFGFFSTIGAKGYVGEPIAVTGYLINLRVAAPWD